MFGLGFGEIVIVLILALVLLGPQRLPDVAKQLGKALRDFRRATDDLKEQFETELYSEPARTPPRPALVEPAKPPDPTQPTVPAAAPLAQAENVPGLDAAVAEPPVAEPPRGEPAPGGPAKPI